MRIKLRGNSALKHINCLWLQARFFFSTKLAEIEWFFCIFTDIYDFSGMEVTIKAAFNAFSDILASVGG